MGKRNIGMILKGKLNMNFKNIKVLCSQVKKKSDEESVSLTNEKNLDEEIIQSDILVFPATDLLVFPENEQKQLKSFPKLRNVQKRFDSIEIIELEKKHSQCKWSRKTYGMPLRSVMEPDMEETMLYAYKSAGVQIDFIQDLWQCSPQMEVRRIKHQTIAMSNISFLQAEWYVDCACSDKKRFDNLIQRAMELLEDILQTDPTNKDAQYLLETCKKAKSTSKKDIK